MRKYQVLYLVDGVERASPWFKSRDRAGRAMKVIRAKYGPP